MTRLGYVLPDVPQFLENLPLVEKLRMFCRSTPEPQCMRIWQYFQDEARLGLIPGTSFTIVQLHDQSGWKETLYLCERHSL